MVNFDKRYSSGNYEAGGATLKIAFLHPPGTNKLPSGLQSGNAILYTCFDSLKSFQPPVYTTTDSLHFEVIQAMDNGNGSAMVNLLPFKNSSLNIGNNPFASNNTFQQNGKLFSAIAERDTYNLLSLQHTIYHHQQPSCIIWNDWLVVAQPCKPELPVTYKIDQLSGAMKQDDTIYIVPNANITMGITFMKKGNPDGLEITDNSYTKLPHALVQYFGMRTDSAWAKLVWQVTDSTERKLTFIVRHCEPYTHPEPAKKYFKNIYFKPYLRELVNGVLLYPNPGQEPIYLEITTQKNDQFNISVVNALGQKVYPFIQSLALHKGIHKINFLEGRPLAAGNYFLHIHSVTDYRFKKVIPFTVK